MVRSERRLAPKYVKQKLYCVSNLKCTNVKIDCVNLSLTAGDANGWSAYEREMNSLS